MLQKRIFRQRIRAIPRWDRDEGRAFMLSDPDMAPMEPPVAAQNAPPARSPDAG